jgi:hypothetical protein
MPIPEIEAFAKILIQEVRDAAIRSCDGSLHPDAKHAVAKRWRAAEHDLKSIGSVIIPDVVDDTLFFLFHAIDNGLLPLAYIDSRGRVVDLEREGLGEMAGWFAGSDGWREQYSHERFVDDSAG